MALSPAGLLERLKGYNLTAEEWNAVVRYIVKAVDGTQNRGMRDGDGNTMTRDGLRMESLWFECRNSSDAVIPIYSVFGISGALGTPDSDAEFVYASQAMSDKPSAPTLLCTNDDNEIPAAGDEPGMGYCRILTDWEECLCKWDGDKPEVGALCGVAPGSYKVTTDRLGLVCTGSRVIGEEEYISVYRVPEPTGLVGTVSEAIGRYDLENEIFGRGKVKVKYRAATDVSGTEDDERTDALSPVDGTEWEFDAFNISFAQKHETGRRGHLVNAMGVGMLFFPIPCAFVLEDCKPVTNPNRLPNGYASNCEFVNYIDKVVKIDGFPATCWRVRLPEDGDNQNYLDAAIPVFVTAVYDDCTYCKSCYKLTECDGGEDPDIKYTNTDLATYVGRVIKLADTEVCYTVEKWHTCSGSTPVEFYDYYETCEPCAYCYHLIGCWDVEEELTTTLDLARLATEQTDADPPIDPEDLYGKVFEINGTCFTVELYDNNCTFTDDPVTVGRYFEDCPYCGCFELLSIGDVVPPVYASGATEGAEPVSLRDYLGKSVRLADGYCYVVHEAPLGDPNCEDAVPVSILEVYDDECKLYRLILCAEEMDECTDEVGEEDIITYTDLEGFGFNVGEIIKLEGGTCHLICDGPDLVFLGSVEVTPDPGTEGYGTCGECLQEVWYELTNPCTNCEEERLPLGTTSDLSAFVGKYIKFRGECWLVNIGLEAEVDTEIPEDPDVYTDCTECKEAESTWEQRIISNIRVDGGTKKIQVKADTVMMTGKGNCDDEGGGDWIDIHTGTACPDE